MTSRAFVVVDRHGEIYSLPRWLGVKTKEVRDRLGDGEDLPAVAAVNTQIAQDMRSVIKRLKNDTLRDLRDENAGLRAERNTMLARHREVRQAQAAQLEKRRWEEARTRQSRFRTGLKGIWDWARGETERIRMRNEEEARTAAGGDRAEIDALIFAQLEEKRRMIDLRREIAKTYADRGRDIWGDIRAYDHLALHPDNPAAKRNRRHESR